MSQFKTFIESFVTQSAMIKSDVTYPVKGATSSGHSDPTFRPSDDDSNKSQEASELVSYQGGNQTQGRGRAEGKQCGLGCHQAHGGESLFNSNLTQTNSNSVPVNAAVDDVPLERLHGEVMALASDLGKLGADRSMFRKLGQS